MFLSYVGHSPQWPAISKFMVLFAIINQVDVAEQTPSTQNNESVVEQRIQRIQEGLLPPVLIKGESKRAAKLTDRMSALRVPGVSIAVIHNNKIDWARGFGVAQIGGRRVTPDTLFQAASISKSITAMAVMQLVQQNKINLDFDVNQYLKRWKMPSNSFTEQSKVTLRRILSHTAGTTVGFFMGYASDTRLPELLQILDGKEPANNLPIRVDTLPGKLWRYSAGGYAVIQQLLNDVTGKSFPDLMHDAIFRPVGMYHSTLQQPLPQSRLVDAAMPYGADGQPIKGGPHIYPEMAAAGLWTTPSDLARYAINIQASLSGHSNRVLSMGMAREMLTPVLDNYGLGLAIGGTAKAPYFCHRGRNVGYCCFLIAYNNSDGAAIMTNGDNGATLYEEILRAIAREYRWPDFQPPARSEIPIAPKIMKQYLGTYELEPGFEMVITLEGDQPMSQATGQSRYPLFAESETKFFWKVSDAEIQFLKNDRGEVTHLILHQGAKDIKAPRR